MDWLKSCFSGKFCPCEWKRWFCGVSSDNLILRLAKAAGEVLGKTHDELMYAFGVYMVKRIGNYGYERILKVSRGPAAPRRIRVTRPSVSARSWEETSATSSTSWTTYTSTSASPSPRCSRLASAWRRNAKPA